MTNLTALSVTIFFILIILLWWRKKKHHQFPPGPTGVPFLGVIPFLNNEPWKIFKRWSLKYGPIISVRMANRDIVVLNNFEVIQQAFVKQSSQFSGRVYNAVLCQNGGRNGIALKDSDAVYKTHKHFVLKTLRGFGFGRKSMEDVINEEADCLVEMLKKNYERRNCNIKKSMFRATTNIISKLSISMRFDYDDNSYDYFIDTLQRLFGDEKDGDMLGMLFIFDILRHLPLFKGVARRYKERDLVICDFLRKRLIEHNEEFDPDNHRDFTDAYINQQRSGTGSNSESFTDEQLIFFLRDFFIGGTETLSASITWMIVVLLNYPQHYETIQEEIDANVGEKETLSMEMLKNMPFTNAMLQELYRFKTAGPSTLLHDTAQDSELSGYFIPKGTSILGNIWGVHNDPDTWKNPEQFDPYRHIDEDGKFIPSKKIIPFSIGPRFCMGESLARVEFFLFTVKLLKNFTFMPNETGLPSLDGLASIIYSPREYEFRLKKRN